MWLSHNHLYNEKFSGIGQEKFSGISHKKISGNVHNRFSSPGTTLVNDLCESREFLYEEFFSGSSPENLQILSTFSPDFPKKDSWEFPRILGKDSWTFSRIFRKNVSILLLDFFLSYLSFYLTFLYPIYPFI